LLTQKRKGGSKAAAFQRELAVVPKAYSVRNSIKSQEKVEKNELGMEGD
jgi:hypothetical protein